MTQRHKSFLGPARSVACQACGKRVSVHWASIFSIIPLIAGGIGAMLVAPSAWAAVPLLAGAIGMFALHAYVVPLVPRDG